MHSVCGRWRKPKKRGINPGRVAAANAARAANRLKRANEQLNLSFDGESDVPLRHRLMDGEISSSPCTSQSKRSHSSDEDSSDENVYRFPTASEKKLQQFQDLLPLEQKSDDMSDYVLVHKQVLQDLYKNFYCPHCKVKAVAMKVGNRRGFSHQLLCECNNCEENIFSCYSSPRLEDKNSIRPGFKVNRSMSEAFLSIGLGHGAMQTFGENMGMQILSPRAFNQHINSLAQDIQTFKTEILKQARMVVRRAHEDENPSLKSKKVIDISVTFDGTWQKRGFTSLYGLGFVIDILTGMVIDFTILSKYCYGCILAEKEGFGSEEFKMWELQHKNSGTCNKNYEGSSPAMEMAAGAILWKRSVKECGMRYVTMLSDGDSKTHSHLLDLKPYGSKININKEECINHVSKRLSSALKKLVSDCRGKKISLGGAGEGQLTERVMIKLASYYRKSLEENNDSVDNMKNAAIATIYHCSSTDKKPNHAFCPKGADSWCFFNQARALKETPKSHKEMSLILNQTVFKHILPVYKRLTNRELLERCQRGGTQNTNESLHSVLWGKCPKETFVSLKRLEIAAALAIAQFNMGRSAALKIKRKSFGQEVSAASLKLALSADKQRLKKSAEALKSNKFMQKKVRQERSAKEKKLLAKEGVTYSAGDF